MFEILLFNEIKKNISKNKIKNNKAFINMK